MVDIEKLSQYIENYIFIENIVPIDEKKDKNSFLILSNMCMLHVNIKTNNVGIAFEAYTKPEITSNFILSLSKYKPKLKLDIMESFIIDDKFNMLTGTEAYNFFNEKFEKYVISQFMKSEHQKFFLEKVNAFSC